jgi:phosphatidylglycerol:prolipoprotein diacylglycerol transferase
MFPIFISLPPEFVMALLAKLGVAPFAPFEIHTYGVLIALGVLLAIRVITREAERRGLSADLFMNLALGLLLWGVIGSRLLFVVLDWQLYVDRPWAVVNIREGGLVFQGGLIGAAIYAIWFMRRNRLAFWETADLVALGIPFGHVFGRLGCLSAGCCFGAPTHVPWAITFTDPSSAGPPLGVPLHPVQLYESFGNLLVFIGLMYLIRRRQRFDGQIVLSYFIAYPVLRFIVEMFRGDVVRGFFLESHFGQLISTSQAISVVELVIAIALYAWRRTRPRETGGAQEAPELGEPASVG